MNIYKELEHIEELRGRIKHNQDQLLDIYDSQDERLAKLLIEMNDLLVEVDEVEAEMTQLLTEL